MKIIDVTGMHNESSHLRENLSKMIALLYWAGVDFDLGGKIPIALSVSVCELLYICKGHAAAYTRKEQSGDALYFAYSPLHRCTMAPELFRSRVAP
ncbi:hypothetical protein BC937DRAFT_86519 [Endogone sp. FLAS-F59071]|nr:hypothetical protein BC937DRAFT_86519 [Endogone sp. FLAS-F59071]|eukprot:RUS12992.1 hypothetical protein BC937DRAFT_86519 [Endogone sp. FLAS-F59071]